jgi:hypothetical protein
MIAIAPVRALRGGEPAQFGAEKRGRFLEEAALLGWRRHEGHEDGPRRFPFRPSFMCFVSIRLTPRQEVATQKWQSARFVDLPRLPYDRVSSSIEYYTDPGPTLMTPTAGPN